MKKVLGSTIMAVLLCLCLLPATALAADAHEHSYTNGFCECGAYEPAVLKDGVYQIGNAGQLYWFAGLVNGTLAGVEQNTAANAVLTDNITVNTGVLKEDGTLADDTSSFKVWTPIGDTSYGALDTDDSVVESNAYAGTFDGRNHTISGLYLNNAEGKNDCALFGMTTSGAQISNLTVADSYFGGRNRVAGVCARNNGRITNCTNRSAVYSSVKTAGGICGWNDRGTITGCTNFGTISGPKYIGGVCGYNDGTISGCINSGNVTGTGDYTGGVCGFNASIGKTENCRNEGTVTGNRYTGGVCGYNNKIGDKIGTITGCTNSGKVTGTSGYTGGVCGSNGGTMTGCTNYGAVSGLGFTGGVCGRNDNTGTITNCTNSGAVTGKNNTGGVCGRNNNTGTITNCTNSGTVTSTGIPESDNYGRTAGVAGYNTGTITGCSNTGTIEATADCTGGVCGYNNSTTSSKGTITNCTNSGTVTGTNYTGGVCGYNADTMTNCTNTNTGTVTGTDDYTGGVCGFNASTGKIENCRNEGTVSGKNFTGGVSGYNNSKNANQGTITNCTNSGDVSSSSSIVGGVCGKNYSGTITNCTNSGAVTGTGTGDSNVGGVCGYSDSGTIIGCTNTGTVTGAEYTGGVCGINYGGSITNCYFNSDAYLGNAVGSSTGTVTDVEGKTAAQFASGEVAWLLNSSTSEGNLAWGQTIGTDGYPVPGGATVYRLNALRCDGQVLDTYVFSNSSAAPIPDHTFGGNTCTVCGYSMPIIPVIPTYPPTVTQPAEGGTVTVSPQAPAQGVTVTVTPKAEDGYEVGGISVTDRNGAPVAVTDNGDGTCSFTQPAGAVTVSVTFTDKTQLAFTDVSADAYYYDAVRWAVKKGITDGTGDGTTFSPNAPCTRAQIVTFLWRAAGCPEPESLSSLSDVPADAYYAKAVAWAVENGITDGVGDNTFAPDATCTRDQAVTFLWRAAGKPSAADGTAFADVSADAYYAPAVQWAAENAVTNGTGDGSIFDPGAICTRGQIVTFLYRWLVK